MPTIYEANKLECRQAHAVGEDGTFQFPRCSGPACGHWRVLQTKEVKTFHQYDHPGMSSENWDAFINEKLANGWRSTRLDGNVPLVRTEGEDRFRYANVVQLVRDLPPEEQTGECGLITDIEVNCSE
jgi:hypothetical protein